MNFQDTLKTAFAAAALCTTGCYAHASSRPFVAVPVEPAPVVYAPPAPVYPQPPVVYYPAPQPPRPVVFGMPNVSIDVNAGLEVLVQAGRALPFPQAHGHGHRHERPRYERPHGYPTHQGRQPQQPQQPTIIINNNNSNSANAEANNGGQQQQPRRRGGYNP